MKRVWFQLMLERIVIRNFQKHQSLTIAFDEQITTLWGPTEAGKSAVFRALRWLVLNIRPNDHVKWGSSFAKVTLYVDGHKIIRKQGEEDNRYVLDKEPLKSFNKGVPTPISDVLKMSEVNFQRQHAAHFWVSLSSSQVSKELNQIVDLGIIDSSLAEAASRVRATSSKITVAEERLADARKHNKSLKWVLEANTELSKIEAEQQHLSDLTLRREGLQVLLSQVQKSQQLTTNLGALIVDGQELLSKAKQAVQLTQKRKNLESILNQLDKAAQYTKLYIPNTKELGLIVDRRIQLESLITEIEDTQWELNQVSRSLDKAEKKLKTMKRICPMCKRPL